MLTEGSMNIEKEKKGQKKKRNHRVGNKEKEGQRYGGGEIGR